MCIARTVAQAFRVQSIERSQLSIGLGGPLPCHQSGAITDISSFRWSSAEGDRNCYSDSSNSHSSSNTDILGKTTLIRALTPYLVADTLGYA